MFAHYLSVNYLIVNGQNKGEHYAYSTAVQTLSKCGRRFWTGMIDDGAGAKIGTTKTVVVTPHSVPDYWCCVTADLRRETLHFHDTLNHGLFRASALNATGAYTDQVYTEQMAIQTGAVSLNNTLLRTLKQPGGVSCGHRTPLNHPSFNRPLSRAACWVFAVFCFRSAVL